MPDIPGHIPFGERLAPRGAQLERVEDIRESFTARGITGGLQRQAIARAGLPEKGRGFATARATLAAQNQARQAKFRSRQLRNLARVRQQTSQVQRGAQAGQLTLTPQTTPTDVKEAGAFKFLVSGPGTAALPRTRPTRLEELIPLIRRRLGDVSFGATRIGGGEAFKSIRARLRGFGVTQFTSAESFGGTR